MKGFNLKRIQGASAKGWLNWMPDSIYLSILYKLRMGVKLHLKNPITFNEKLQWLKLYDRRPEYTHMVDKYEAKKYVAECIGDEYVVPTFGVWDKFNDINFALLPNQFVLKCTHDSGGLIIVRDKNNLNWNAAREKIEKSLSRNYYWACREWPYKNVKPRIIAEKYMTDKVNSEAVEKGLTDYKFFCFNGEPKFIYISEGLEKHKTASISFVTLDWQFAPYERIDYKSYNELPLKPSKLNQMIDICKVLSANIPFVRVDLYLVSENIYFSELTLSPCSGFIPFKNPEHDIEIGQMLDLPQKI